MRRLIILPCELDRKGLETIEQIVPGWMDDKVILVVPGQTEAELTKVNIACYTSAYPPRDEKAMGLAAQIAHRLMGGKWEMPADPMIMTPKPESVKNLASVVNSCGFPFNVIILGVSSEIIRELPAYLAENIFNKTRWVVPKVEKDAYGLRLGVDRDEQMVHTCEFLTPAYTYKAPKLPMGEKSPNGHWVIDRRQVVNQREPYSLPYYCSNCKIEADSKEDMLRLCQQRCKGGKGGGGGGYSYHPSGGGRNWGNSHSA